MLIYNTKTKYGMITKVLHWLIALLILTQFLLIYWKRNVLNESSPTAKALINAYHKPFGMVVFLLGIFFIIWRLTNIKPAFPPAMASWERRLARATHLLLYLVILIFPLSGLLSSVSAGHPPNFFGLFQVPQFIAIDPMRAKFFFKIHESTALVFITLVSLHTLAALKHHFINRDPVLKRML